MKLLAVPVFLACSLWHSYDIQAPPKTVNGLYCDFLRKTGFPEADAVPPLFLLALNAVTVASSAAAI